MNTAIAERVVQVAAHRDLCAHEAAHASAGLLSGLRIQEVNAPPATYQTLTTEPDRPDDPAGYTRFNLRTIENDRAQMYSYALALVAPLIHEGRPVPGWPLSPPAAAASSDSAQAIRLAMLLGLDRDEYNQLVKDATDLVCSTRFERLHTAIAYALEKHGRLDAHALDRIKAIALGEEDRVERKMPITTDTIQRDASGKAVWDWKRGWPPSSMVDTTGPDLRDKALALERELGPIVVARFDA